MNCIQQNINQLEMNNLASTIQKVFDFCTRCLRDSKFSQFVNLIYRYMKGGINQGVKVDKFDKSLSLFTIIVVNLTFKQKISKQMFLFIFVALAFNARYKFGRQSYVENEVPQTQLSCVQRCMKDRKLGRITVMKREMCGQKCQHQLNLPVDDNDDSK